MTNNWWWCQWPCLLICHWCAIWQYLKCAFSFVCGGGGGGLQFELSQGFALAKQALYCFSHTSSALYSALFSVFWRWDLKNYLPRLASTGLNPWSSRSQPPKYLGLQVWATGTWLLPILQCRSLTSWNIYNKRSQTSSLRYTCARTFYWSNL
jgi:hypothetical protein